MLRAERVITGAFDEVIHNGAVLVEDGRIESVGPYEALSRAYPLAPVREGPGLVALPGLIDSHSHGRGLSLAAHDMAQGPLELFFLRLAAMTRVDPSLDALVAGADLVSTGITAAQVSFYSLAAAEAYHRDALATLAGLGRSAVRVAFVLSTTEQNELIPAEALAGLPDEIERDLLAPEHTLSSPDYFEIFALLTSAGESGGPDAELGFVLGPGAPQWCSEATLTKVGDLMREGVRAQTHLLETRLQRGLPSGVSPVVKLSEAGMLAPGLSAAHGVWLTDEEIALVADRGATLVHCPSSNVHLGSGTARVRGWLDAGVEVGLGLDSNSRTDPPDAFVEIRHVREVAASAGTDISHREALAMATSGGASAMGLPGDLGVLRPGVSADLVFLELPQSPGSSDDEVADVVDQASRQAVRSVWVGGREVVGAGRHELSFEVSQARAHLLAEVARGESQRREQLRRIARAEPWATAIWANLDSAAAGDTDVMR